MVGNSFMPVRTVFAWAFDRLPPQKQDAELRGLVNVCRHRLHPVATANGNARLLRCSYHGLTYELDSRLRHAARQNRGPGFDCSAISLRPVSLRLRQRGCRRAPHSGR